MNEIRIITDGGLSIGRYGSAYTISPPEKIHPLNQFTIYIDLATESSGLSSLEKIVGYFINQREMNFFVGQWKDGLSFHLPDEKRNRIIHFGAEGLLEQDRRTTLLVGYDGTKLVLLQDGKVRTYRETGPLTFNGWSKEYPLVIGTDADGKAQWKGTIYEIAVYDRALTTEEIKSLSSLSGQNIRPQAISRKPQGNAAGRQGIRLQASGFEKKIEETDKRPLIHYVFTLENTYETEFRGGKALAVRDLGKRVPADLVIPVYFMPYKRAYLKWELDWVTIKANWQDTVVNVIGFIPFGFLLLLGIGKWVCRKRHKPQASSHKAEKYEIAAHPLDARNDAEGKENPPVSPMGRFAPVAEVKEVTKVAKVKDEKIPCTKGGGKEEIAAGLAPFAMTYCGTVLAIVLAVVVGFGVSFAIEYTQAYLPSRDSSLRDLITNTLGTAIGAMAAAWYARLREKKC